MATRWRYYNSKRGNGNNFRGRGRGRGRGTNFTAVSLPRQDYFHEGIDNEAYFQDKPVNAKEFVDETVLSLSFSQFMLGAACYEQSTQLVRIMNDISDDHEFSFLKRLLEEIRPTTIIANKSQDLAFIKFLSSQCTIHEKLQPENTETTNESTEETLPTWDASLMYSTDEPEEKDQDEENTDGPPATLYKLPNDFFKMPRALQRLKVMVGADDNNMTDEEKSMIVAMRFDIEAVNMIRSFGALLLFLDETRLGVESEPLSVPSPIKSIRTMTLENIVDIDYSTIQALDILPKEVESKKSAGKDSSLFAFIDRCRSTVGKKCLKKWFRNPTTDKEILVSRQKCVHYFKQDWNAEVTSKVSSLLGKVKSLNNVFQKFESGTSNLLHWECFVSTVNALIDMFHIIRQTPISNELAVDNSLLAEVSEISVIAGAIIDFAESKSQGRVTVMPGIDEELDRLRNVYENMPMVLTAVAKQECANLGIAPYNNVACVYIPLVGFVLSLPTDFPVEAHRDMSLVYAKSDELRVRNETTEKLDDEYGDILMKLIDSQTAIILTLKTRVLKKKRSINKLLSVAARADALLSLGLVAAENGWNCPTLIDEPAIEALELFHPMSAMVVKKSFVPNRVSSGRDGIKASIITGPNACGKSVYMKSIGILAFLAHIGSFVPARHAKIGKVDRIVTRMFTVDSVLDGMSTFAKDVDQVALALRKATGSSLVIIDEFGKGTMTEVGLALLASCMTYWIKKGPEHCPHIFLASHFHALPEHIPLDNHVVAFLTFKVVREGEGKIKYLFQLTPGMVDCSFAMAVAKEEGIPMPIIGRACRIYKALKSGTPLKQIKAEVAKNNDERLVADMDIVLKNETGFLDAVESFVVREQRKGIEAKAWSETVRARELESSNSATAPIQESSNYQANKAHSVISSKSVQSIDSVFDAMLPKKKGKRAVARNDKDADLTRDSTKSPDPFSIDEDEAETKSECEKEETRASRALVPSLQRLESEEEKEKGVPVRSRSSTTPSCRRLNQLYATPESMKSDDRTGTKRLRNPSTCEAELSQKTAKMVVDKQILTQDLHVPETPDQPPRTSSSRLMVTAISPLNDHVLVRGLGKTTDDSMFKTPTSTTRLQKHSSQAVPKDNMSVHSSMRTPKQNKDPQNLEHTPETQEKSFSFTNNSIFSTQEASQVNLNMATPRASSRCKSREGDFVEYPETPRKNRSSFTPMGSPSLIFSSQQTIPGDFFRDSRRDVSPFLGNQTIIESRNNESQKKCSQNSQRVVFETPKSKTSDIKSRTFPKNTSTQSTPVSPRSFILDGFGENESQNTTRPRGDRETDFEFEFLFNDNNPPNWNDDHSLSPQFEFLNAKDNYNDGDPKF